MDTKSKSNSRAGILACVAVVLLLTVCFMLACRSGYKAQVDNRESYFDQPEFAENIYLNCYALYWKMAQQKAENLYLTPSQAFLPGLRETLTLYYGDPTDDIVYEEITVQFDSQIEDLYAEYLNDWGAYTVAVRETTTGEAMGNTDSDVARLLDDDIDAALEEALQEKFQYYAQLSFGPGGELHTPRVHGVTTEYFTSQNSADIRRQLLGFIDYYSDLYQISDDALLPIANMVYVFAIPADAHEPFYYDTLRYELWSMTNYGYGIMCIVALVLTGLLGLFMVSRKRLALTGWRAARLAPELSLGFGFLSVVLCEKPLLEYTVRVYRGSMAFDLAEDGVLAALAEPLSVGVLGLWSFAIIALMFVAAMSLYQIRTLGPLRYLRERSLIARGGRQLARLARRLYAWITDIDLTEKSGRGILKLLAPNLIVMVLLCMVGPVGMVGAVAYSVLLFFLVRRYLAKLRRDYAHTLNAARKMAGGELDVELAENVGVFEPLKAELLQVQDSFQKAVEAEVKSQNMKTELITNVSHDLKTPLTAIITYVELLKKDGATKEEKEEYIHTLDLKSQRLKRLIDDLFEMSKASSRDITLNLGTVDLQALLRQVAMEAGDELATAEIEFRYNFPDGKTQAVLDGEKTSRIFENLMLNVAKYGMPGTRAYCTVHEEDEDTALVEVKNVSRDELNFDNEAITERFVRGDLSRSTEGSGLGLAIAKSFTEAQGGQFWIETDGDLFKAFVRLPRQAQTP